MGHIRELPDRDEMDWRFYYNEGLPKDLTDAQWRAEIGHRGWKILHGAIESYPCTLCRDSGTRLMHGLHDVVNVHTGKAARYPEDLLFLKQGVDSAVRKVQSLNISVRHVQPAPMVVRHG